MYDSTQFHLCGIKKSILYCIVTHAVILYFTVSYHPLYNEVLYHVVVPYCIVSSRVLLYHIASYCMYCSVLVHIVLYRFVCRVVLYRVVSYCIALCHIISCRVVLYRIASYRVVSYPHLSYCIYTFMKLEQIDKLFRIFVKPNHCSKCTTLSFEVYKV